MKTQATPKACSNHFKYNPKTYIQRLCREEDALDEAEMPASDYEQKQRLMEIAKAHTAQLMAKLDDLPADQRQAFLQDQVSFLQASYKSVQRLPLYPFGLE